MIWINYSSMGEKTTSGSLEFKKKIRIRRKKVTSMGDKIGVTLRLKDREAKANSSSLSVEEDKSGSA